MEKKENSVLSRVGKAGGFLPEALLHSFLALRRLVLLHNHQLSCPNIFVGERCDDARRFTIMIQLMK